MDALLALPPRHFILAKLHYIGLALAAFVSAPLTAWSASDGRYYDHAFVMGVGLHSGQGRAPFGKGGPVLSYAGATSTRQEVTWSRIEQEKDELKYPANLKDVEDYVNDAVKKGGRPLIVLDYGNKFYDDGDVVYSDEAIEGFARYAAFVANHFKGRVKFYDVWNEWDIGMGSNKKPRTIRDVPTYIKLLKATYQALKKADPDAKVLGGVATTSHTEWNEKFIKGGGLDYLDAFSTHPYLMWNIQSKPEYSIASLDELHRKIEAARPSRKIPIYVTEVGWPNHKGPISWTPKQTADFVIRFHLLARTRPYIGGVWWYSLSNDAKGQDNREKAFGLVDYDYNPKPALEAYKLTSELILNMSSISQASTPLGPQEVKMDIKLKSGETCQADWLVSMPPRPYEISDTFRKANVLWGSKDTLSETPLIVCK